MDAPEAQSKFVSGYPVVLRLAGAPVLVIGGDDEAARRCGRLVASGALVRVVWPDASDSLRALAVRRAVHWYARAFTPEDARGCRMVLQTVRDPALAERVHAQGRREGFWFCAIDQPAHGDFSHVAIAEAGPVQVAISTTGTAPSLARRMREELQQALDARFADFAAEIARIRATGEPDFEARKTRVEAALDGFALEVSVRYPSWERTVNRNHR